MDKITAALQQLILDNRELTTRLERLEKVKPIVTNGKDGKDGKDGVSPSVDDIVELVVAQLPEPERVDTNAIIHEVLAQMPKPRDGRDAHPVNVSDVAAIVLAKIEKPKDGRDGITPDVNAIVNRVKAQVKDGAQGPRGEKGPKGDPGKNGVSITDVQLVNNDLFVSLDGKKKKVGSINIPTPVRPMTSAGGGGRTSRAEIERIICNFLNDVTLVQSVASYNVLPSDRSLYVRAIDAPITINLLTADDSKTCPIEIKRSEDSNYNVIVVPVGSQTIENESQRVINVSSWSLRLKTLDGNWKEY